VSSFGNKYLNIHVGGEDGKVKMYTNYVDAHRIS